MFENNHHQLTNLPREGSSQVRNLGKPVELATKYYNQGADEITFLNITSFRNSPLKIYPCYKY